jgi:3',5'-cyclic AMP phosphodiesterase CpdA
MIQFVRLFVPDNIKQESESKRIGKKLSVRWIPINHNLSFPFGDEDEDKGAKTFGRRVKVGCNS